MCEPSVPGGEHLGDDVLWQPWSPDEVARRFASTPIRWYVVAGWALDLFRGGQSREHGDIEIGIPAADFPRARSSLRGFEFDVVGSGERWPIESDAAREAHFQTWVRDPSTGAYHLDIFRDPHDGDTWICRRDRTIRLAYDELICATPDGIPYMAPQVVLLFKAKHQRDKDQLDFDGVVDLLDAEQVRWLRSSLEAVHPGHPWLNRLARPALPDAT